MGLFKKREAGLSSHHSNGHPPKEGPIDGPADSNINGNDLAEQKVTWIACILGAVASIGGFIFGYIRYGLSLPADDTSSRLAYMLRPRSKLG